MPFLRVAAHRASQHSSITLAAHSLHSTRASSFRQLQRRVATSSALTRHAPLFTSVSSLSSTTSAASPTVAATSGRCRPLDLELLPRSPFAVLNMTSTSTPKTQTRTAHSHGGHNHAHDNTYLVSANKSDAGVRITRIGLYVNLGMAIVKAVGGYAFNSKALLADAIHSLTDLIADFMTLATVSWSLKPPTERFPNAYGKVESLGSMGVSGILLMTGYFMAQSSILELCNMFIPGFAEALDAVGISAGHSHSHNDSDLGPHINAAWLAAGSIAIKEWLYRATLKIANERKSAVLAANAYHHRVDSLTAVVALLMIGGSNVMNNAAWLDPVGGLVISLMVVQAGWGTARESLLELADVTIDEEMKEKVRMASLTALEENKSTLSPQDVDVRLVSGMKAGQNYIVDIELGVPEQWTVEDTLRVESLVRAKVGSKVKGVKKVKFRFVPRSTDGPELSDEFISPSVSPRDSPEPEEHSHNGHSHKH